MNTASGRDAGVSVASSDGGVTPALGGSGRAGDAGGGTAAMQPPGADAGGAGNAQSAEAGASAPSSSGADDDYSILACPGTTPNEIPFELLPSCDGEITCGERAHCIPLDRLSPQQVERLPDCSTGKCLPDRLAVANRFSFKSCTGDLGEGRCVPQCFGIKHNPLASLLPLGASGCGKEEICAPCNDPIDGTPTPACNYDPCADEAS